MNRRVSATASDVRPSSPHRGRLHPWRSGAAERAWPRGSGPPWPARTRCAPPRAHPAGTRGARGAPCAARSPPCWRPSRAPGPGQGGSSKSRPRSSAPECRSTHSAPPATSGSYRFRSSRARGSRRLCRIASPYARYLAERRPRPHANSERRGRSAARGKRRAPHKTRENSEEGSRARTARCSRWRVLT